MENFIAGKFYKAKKDIGRFQADVSYMAASDGYSLFTGPEFVYPNDRKVFFELNEYLSPTIGDLKPENDPINPNHYKSYSVEVIDMMERIWGPEAVAIHCECCAFKYRMRAGMKDGIEEQYNEELWYLDKARELRNKLKS